jgi:hypothetical protein
MSIGEQVIDDLFSSYHHLLVIGQLHGISLPKYTTKERRARSPWTTTLPAAIIGGDIKPCLKKVPDDDKTLPPCSAPLCSWDHLIEDNQRLKQRLRYQGRHGLCQLIAYQHDFLAYGCMIVLVAALMLRSVSS